MPVCDYSVQYESVPAQCCSRANESATASVVRPAAVNIHEVRTHLVPCHTHGPDGEAPNDDAHIYLVVDGPCARR